MDESVVHDLARKVGGRFHLTALIQKRLIQLNRGAKPMVEPQETALRTVIEELLQGKLDVEKPDLGLGAADELSTTDPRASEPG